MLKVSKAVREGAVIAFPTDTVYGIGGNALDERVIERVFALKGKNRSEPLPVNISDSRVLKKYVTQISPAAEKLIKQFWPGPLTLIFKKKKILPDLLCGHSNSGGRVGVRVPDCAFTLALLRACEIPLISTSANFSGEKPCLSAGEVLKCFPHGIDIIVEGPVRLTGVPSTVVDVTSGAPKLVRQGAIPWDKILNEL